MIAPHVLGGADEESASPETIKKAAGPPATPQESNNSKESTEIPSYYQPPPEPWGELVDGEELLNEIRDMFNRHVILPDHAAVTLALWIMHTYSCQFGRVSSYIALLSPVPECGKTTAASIVQHFCYKACTTANITGAGIFRIIDKYSPTLLIDELDTFLSGNEQLRGILNAGYTR
jgi:putative DNA primase/helicase